MSARVSLYEYEARVSAVYDGDTCRLDLDLGFHTWRFDEQVRLFGINTPEIRGEDKAAALAARDALRGRCLGKMVWVRTIKDGQDKYGRFLAVLYDRETGDCINDWLVAEGHAVPFMI